MNCGAELTDEAKFCRNCGTPTNNPNKGGDGPTVTARTSDDGEGIVIDAPEDATVTISDMHETEAPDADGEFVVASWPPPRPKQSAKPKQSVKPKEAAKPEETTRPEEPAKPKKKVKKEKIVEPEEPVEEEETFDSEEDDEPGWKSLLVNNLWTFVKVLVIVVAAVLAMVIFKGLLTGDGSRPDAPANSQELPIEQQSTVVDDKESSAPARPNHSAAQKEDDITIIGEEEEDNDGFGHLDDMPLHEKIEYMEGLLERSEAALNEELAKGNAADQSYIRELRKGIAELRQALSEVKQ